MGLPFNERMIIEEHPEISKILDSSCSAEGMHGLSGKDCLMLILSYHDLKMDIIRRHMENKRSPVGEDEKESGGFLITSAYLVKRTRKARDSIKISLMKIKDGKLRVSLEGLDSTLMSVSTEIQKNKEFSSQYYSLVDTYLPELDEGLKVFLSSNDDLLKSRAKDTVIRMCSMITAEHRKVMEDETRKQSATVKALEDLVERYQKDNGICCDDIEVPESQESSGRKERASFNSVLDDPAENKNLKGYEFVNGHVINPYIGEAIPRTKSNRMKYGSRAFMKKNKVPLIASAVTAVGVVAGYIIFL